MGTNMAAGNVQKVRMSFRSLRSWGHFARESEAEKRSEAEAKAKP